MSGALRQLSRTLKLASVGSSDERCAAAALAQGALRIGCGDEWCAAAATARGLLPALPSCCSCWTAAPHAAGPPRCTARRRAASLSLGYLVAVAEHLGQRRRSAVLMIAFAIVYQVSGNNLRSFCLWGSAGLLDERS